MSPTRMAFDHRPAATSATSGTKLISLFVYHPKHWQARLAGVATSQTSRLVKAACPRRWGDRIRMLFAAVDETVVARNGPFPPFLRL
jgi:hypothetical protein